jgi:cytochrome c oxidase cbb3-type subunit 3
MSSRSRNSLFALALLALLGGCSREKRQDGDATPPPPIAAASPDTILPGGAQSPPLDPRFVAYEGNAYQIAQGQRLFGWMNCSGCHSHGGGGMGPALMDGKWRYGGRIDQIAASIVEGRPGGMPSWRSKLTDEQVWQLSAYVRSLSGQVRKDAVAARADEMSNTPPNTQTEREPVRSAETGPQ